MQIFLTLREWMRRMATRASGPGGGNSILRSIRPGRKRAESRMSDKGSAGVLPSRLMIRTYPICGHDDLDVLGGLEAIQLVEKLQHGPLHLGIAARGALHSR